MERQVEQEMEELERHRVSPRFLLGEGGGMLGGVGF